jgi:hypothetical protein
MYGTSPEMLQRMYVKGSLQNRGNGFVFQITNRIESGSLSGVAKVSVDGKERSLEGATVELGGKVREVGEITWSSPLYVSYGSTLTIFVPGALESGEHTVNTQFNVPELGRISMPITDTVA